MYKQADCFTAAEPVLAPLDLPAPLAPCAGLDLDLTGLCTLSLDVAEALAEMWEG